MIADGATTTRSASIYPLSSAPSAGHPPIISHPNQASLIPYQRIPHPASSPGWHFSHSVHRDEHGGAAALLLTALLMHGSGGLYDADTQLVRFGVRDDDTTVERWTAKDPINFEGRDPNLYGYVLDVPVNRVDPKGTAGPLATDDLQHQDLTSRKLTAGR